MQLPELHIRDFSSRFPVIQAGMGVRVGTGKLAGTVINAGGMGVIASVGLGDIQKMHDNGYVEESNCRLREEIREVRHITGGKGPLGVNVMVALTNYEMLVRNAIDEGVEFIISGAGIPRNLPAYVKEDTALIPVVSSGRGLEVIIRTWRKKFNRVPDAVIVEGPLCGGHLGFTYEEINNPDMRSIDKLLKETKEILEKEGLDIPLIAAEGVNERKDIERFIAMGFQGVQIGTRFICVEESGMAPSGREMYIKAKKEDVVVIKSPVGLPVRVLKSPLVERVLRGEKEKFFCPYKCLITCDKKTVPFCIAQVLLEARAGNQEKGLFMTGCMVEDVKSVITVQEFFDTLK